MMPYQSKINTAASRSTQPSGSLLVWEKDESGQVIEKAHLRGHPETTLFFLSTWDGDCWLSGAFMPDEEELLTRDPATAKREAERFMIEWCSKIAPEIAADSERSDLRE